MVMVSAVAMAVDMTLWLRAAFGGCFQFQRGVCDSKLVEVLPYLCFQLRMVCDNMHGGAVILSVNSPDVDMVHIVDTVDGEEAVADLQGIHRCFFQEYITDFSKIEKGIDKHKYGNANADQRVQQTETGEAHHNSTDQYRYPAQQILQHVQIDCLLIETVSAVGKKGSKEIDTNTNNGQQDHPVIVDFCGVQEPMDTVCDHTYGTNQQNSRSNKAA